MRSARATDRARIAQLDAEMSLQRAQVQERLDAYKYPVSTLPNEIIFEIFVHFVPDYPSCPKLIGRHSPTLLTQICRKWRAIALETPALWRAIMLPDPNIPPGKQAGLADVWLSRSRGCPISFHFDKDLTEDEGVGCGTEILSTIVPYRSRLEHLVIRLFCTPQFRVIEGPMPLLRHLEVQVEDQDDPFDVQASFLEAPLLRTALINGMAVGKVMLPWTQLTSLALHRVWLEECAPIFKQTFNLVHCELIITGYLHEDDIAILPSLQTLTLAHIREHASVIWFLQTIIVPSLRSLRVQESCLGPNPIDTLKSFLSKSGCGLQELCVVGPKSGSNASYHTAFPSTEISFTGWTQSFANPSFTFR
ncbi:hypothetical protein C8R45DRAFT_583390 [Mycena sanguinolenta]|nr:hypothetical protein C8R45DRAFT_583390 [Mycena sanguinolenta]